MVTQKDVHNIIVENASPFQKAYISMQYGGNTEKIMNFEQAVADLVNGMSCALANSGTDYLNQKV